ncbi:MAG: nicotinate-nucleotide adenylyltransferase [Bacteroidales bacterium]|nr:nicotinate-nucleotide adenylyltransferase [Bacteroidales bacterium]
MKHIGLFFGSFNPIHVGHLIVANSMLEHTDMDEVWFVVSPQNPLKERRTLLADHHRLAMVREAIEDNYRMRASDVEFHLPIPSYTVVTLAQLSDRHPDKRFSLIMGGDNLENFRRWRNWEHIIENYEIFVYPRPGAVANDLVQHPHVHLVDVPMMDISSSYIRRQIAEGHPPRYLLTEPVFKYLTEMHFYE